MRETDHPETFQPLGSPIRPEPPTPEPRQSGTPGIVIDPDGRHRTVDYKPGQGLHARSAPVLALSTEADAAADLAGTPRPDHPSA